MFNRQGRDIEARQICFNFIVNCFVYLLRYVKLREETSTQTFNMQEKCQTCVLLAEAGHDLRSSFQVSVHVSFPQPPHHHAHPLQGRGEGELTHDADLTGLRRKRRTWCICVRCNKNLQISFYHSLTFWEYESAAGRWLA